MKFTHIIDDDDNLVVFPPKEDDTSYTLIYSVLYLYVCTLKDQTRVCNILGLAKKVT